MSKEAYDLDLDMFTNDKRTVHIKGKSFEFEIPEIDVLLRIMNLAAKLQKLDSSEDSIDKGLNFIEQIRRTLDGLCPGLEKEKLNFKQLMALVQFSVESGMPQDKKVLAKKGITFDNDQKKMPPVS